jgi:hypothetical protein
MRGRPLLEFLVFVLVWGALLVAAADSLRVPVERAQDDVALPVTSAKRCCRYLGTFAFFRGPGRLCVAQAGGVPVWEEADPDVDQEYPVEMANGMSRAISCWLRSGRRKVGGPIEVRVAPPVGPARSVIVWHEGRFAEEALLF